MPVFIEIQLERRKLEAINTLLEWHKPWFDANFEEIPLLMLTNQKKALFIILTNQNKAFGIKRT